ncbi:aspartate--ammonia ligase [Candidatus Woesearchaeota archaeon]|nr:aspartate--ammonia ligase [Candidatus Woesearchaeota archaeon]
MSTRTSSIKIPEGYTNHLSLRETEVAIKRIKDFFQDGLAKALKLQRVSAPLFVSTGTGINDDLNGTEKKVSFRIKAHDDSPAEIVFSLAKWKRLALSDYGFGEGEGLYADMNAIRPDEDVLDNLHSVYVDQWDWEKIIGKEDRSLDYLRQTVRKIYSVMKDTERMICSAYPGISPVLPDEITFLHTEDLLKSYPDISPKQREDLVAGEYGAVFLIGIGGELEDGSIHDGRAPDYDDWTTETVDGKRGLNGDIIVWHPVLQCAFEISSMGIRVDKDALMAQLMIRDAVSRKEQDWHKRLLRDELPLSIGGGIGQSRLCMFFLRKAHIGEVQSSIWPASTLEECRKAGISLL